MGAARVRVRRERPTGVAVAIVLCVTMLMVHGLTLNMKGPDVVQSMAAAPRVTRQIEFEKLEGWCVAMARCQSQQEARLQASAWTGQGAAGYVTELKDGWAVLGALYDTRKEAERVARRLREDEDIPAEAGQLAADGLTLRITAPQIGADAVRALCAMAASEAGEAARGLAAVPGAGENALCAGLIERLDALAELQQAVADSEGPTGASLSGMLRCAQLEGFLGQWRMNVELAGR